METFSECGCNDCPVLECWSICEDCQEPIPYCRCEHSESVGVEASDDLGEDDEDAEEAWWLDI
jgi:hypothetical protein